VRLWIKAGPLTIRNNGGGTGNVRTLTGLDRVVATNEIVEFAYDGAVWREQNLRLSSAVLMDYTVAGAAVASIDTNAILGGNIPQTYNHLIVYLELRGTDAAVSISAPIQFNGDTGANYDYSGQYVSGGGGTGTLSGGVSATSLTMDQGTIAAAGSTASIASSIRMEIPWYRDTNWKRKALFTVDGMYDQAIGTREFALTGIGHWRNAAALTRIKVTPSASLWAIGSRMMIYGVN
jgi:hypothetical protein